MIVIGLFGFGTNPGACLMRDGELVAFAEEERFTRLKGSHGFFPGRAVAYCLRQAQLELGDVDRLAFAWDSVKYPYRMLGSIARQYLKYRWRAERPRSGGDPTLYTVLSSLVQYSPRHLREEIRLGLRASGLRGEMPPVEFVPHHLCHSYSAYFCSPFEDAVVLSIDGSGEEVCTQIAVGRGERLEVRSSVPIPHSLGWFYAAFTAFFGFRPYGHEGKLMALAGLGHERAGDNPWPERLAEILKLTGAGYEVDPIYTRFGNHTLSDRFTDALAAWVSRFDAALTPLLPGERTGAKGSPSRCLERGYVDLAWGVQQRLEHAAKDLATRAAHSYASRNLCLAGGVGLNCKMNGALLAQTPFERIFVQPASYDAGAAIGAAMVVAEAGGDRIRNTLENAYLGPGWTSDEIAAEVAACGLTAQRCGDVAARAAEELARGRFVGWFQGRMELGPRALGARSILASPLVPDVQGRLNRDVKSREPWRPFSPAMLSDAKEAHLVGAAEAPFMTVAFAARPEQRAALRAVSHVDGSVRPQTVTARACPLFHRLLSEFRERSGVPFVVNTSFNGNEEPIVCSPREALRAFYASGLDALAIGDSFLTKT